MSFVGSSSRPVARTLSAVVAAAVSTALVVGGLSGVAWAEDAVEATPTPAAPAGAEPGANDSDGDGKLDAADTVSAGVMAKLLKKKVEDLSQRSETDTTFAMPDGSWTMETRAAPVRVLQDEKWVDVDYTLVEQPDGSWAPKASPLDVTVNGAGANEAARVTYDDGQSVAITWPETLPEPTVGKTVATYTLSDTTDLLVDVAGGVVNTHLRLNEAPAESDPVFTFGLASEGLDVSKSAGGLKLVDDRGDVVTKTPPLVAWDARTDDAGSPLETVPLESKLTETSSDGDQSTQELELTPPDGFLTDPATQYPVIIDPSLRDLSLLRDSWVRKDDSTNHYLESQLVVGKIQGSNNVNPAQSFLKFHSGQFAGKQVNSATLNLWQTSAQTCSDRNMNVYPVTTNWSDNMTWDTRGAVTSAHGTSVSENRGYGTICGGGWTTADVTDMARAWAGGFTNEGIRLAVSAADEGQSSFERRFCSGNCSNATVIPKLTVEYNTPPDQPQIPAAAGMMRGGTFYADSITPRVATGSTDSDDDPDDLAYYIGARYVNGTAPGGWGDAGCYTPWVPAGQWSDCRIAKNITDGHTYELKALAHDAPFGTVTPSNTWSGGTNVTIDASTPPKPAIECKDPSGNPSPYPEGKWTVRRTVTSITCTATSSGAYDMIFTKNKTNTPETVTGSTVTRTVAVPLNGVVALDFTARSKSGNSATSSHTFGVGASSMLPVEEERTSTTVPMLATSETGALSAKLQWRPAGSADTAWVDAKKTGNEFDNVRVASTNAKWTGAVQSDSAKSAVDLIWSPNSEPNISAPSHVESRIVFVYVNNLLMETPARSVQVVPHAFGGSFPSQDLGPGQVALFTGEFQLSKRDVDVAGPSGSLSLGRSHLSLGGATSGPSSVFGPGWAADFAGPDYGVANYTVDDRRADDGSIYITSPDGESFGYGKQDGSVGPTLTGKFTGLGEYAVEEDYLDVKSATELSFVEADRTVTKFTKTGSTWLAQEVVSAEANSTVTYAHEGTNVSWIFAPKPGGVTSCDKTSQTPGCRALELVYTTFDGKARVSEVKLHIWNPKPAADGKPDTATAGMDTVIVAKYSYTTDGKLSAAWDPRADSGTNSLKTEYTYDTVGGKTVVKTVKDPGLKAWTINYDDKTRVKTITRAQDEDVAGANGPATWTVQYGIGLSANGDGLPDLSPAKTATWGQPELDAPYGGAAVFGPDQVPDATPTASQYEYARLSYWTPSGRTSNTASYGAGAWQIDSTRYDDKGNPVWQLSPAGKVKVLGLRDAAATDAKSEATRVAASKYATLTTYTTGEERRVTATYGPTSLIRAQDSNAPTGVFEGRKLTRTVYDDTTNVDLKPGYPSAGVPDGGFGLPVETTERVTTGVFPYEPGSAGAPTEFDVDTTRYRYNPVVASDGDGWQLRSPTRVMVKVRSDPEKWSTTMTRFDTEGKVIETRTPEGTETTNGAGSDSRSTKTTYYTVGANSGDSACGNAPAWAGLVCKTALAGGNAPATQVKGYSMLLAPTRVEKTYDGAFNHVITSYDAAGRTKTSNTSTSGLAVADRTLPTVTTNYSPDTGAVTSVTGGGKDQVYTHDSWGRARTISDGTGSAPAETTYDQAGRVKTSNDGKATYTFTYNGTDARDKRERRGLVTSLEVGKPTGIEASTPSKFTGAYDESGGLIEQLYPGGVRATLVRNNDGIETGLSYSKNGTELLGYASTVDVDGRVITQTGGGSSQEFAYDKRDRLTRVKDTRGGQCTTRKYDFSGDSNRRKLTTYAPATSGACQDTTGTTVESRFNDDDQLISDSYDKLGRTNVLDLGSGGTATIGYHANDMVATVAQGSKTQDYTLDLSGRVSTVRNKTDSITLSEATNHYVEGDSPSWIETRSRLGASGEWVNSWERNVYDLTGNLGLVQRSTNGSTILQLANLRGDVAATYTLGTSPTFTAASAADEYGEPLANPDGARYGWHGSNQRDSTPLAGLILMGRRLYNPTSGRFLSRDPVPGGNDNPYTYPADPVNNTDLTGESADTNWTYGAWYTRRSWTERESVWRTTYWAGAYRIQTQLKVKTHYMQRKVFKRYRRYVNGRTTFELRHVGYESYEFMKNFFRTRHKYLFKTGNTSPWQYDSSYETKVRYTTVKDA
jgi:RHS repeat-associated protein